MADGTCSFCGEPTVYFFPGGLCVSCTSKNARIRMQEQPTQSRELSAFDASVGVMQAATRRTEIAAEKIQKNKRVVGTSLREFDAAHPIALTEEGQRAALALGLVHYKTTQTGGKPTGTVTIEIDPLQSKAQRLRKSVITGARLHDQEARKGSRQGAWYMLTLTYDDGSNASPGDVSGLLACFRSHLNRTANRRSRFKGQSLRYIWVGELTQRLRPHYHLLIWVAKGIWFGKPDQKGWWKHGHTKMEKARNCVGYLAKYASKFTALTAGAFPKGFRTHGVGGLNSESKRELRWWKAPKDARDALGGEADIRKAKGGWFDKLTGEFWPSPWKVTFLFGRTFAWKVVQL